MSTHREDLRSIEDLSYKPVDLTAITTKDATQEEEVIYLPKTLQEGLNSIEKNKKSSLEKWGVGKVRNLTIFPEESLVEMISFTHLLKNKNEFSISVDIKEQLDIHGDLSSFGLVSPKLNRAYSIHVGDFYEAYGIINQGPLKGACVNLRPMIHRNPDDSWTLDSWHISYKTKVFLQKECRGPLN
jgi:hypothetical protein